jgi:hypothetical protein
MKKQIETREAVMASVAQQPCKPRAHSTHTDRLPMTYRPGALDADSLPRVHGGWRIWPDGRKEKL